MKKACPNCSRIFETDNKRKKYCDKICFKAVRKAQHNRNTIVKYRRENGVYQKWIKELTSIGYLVIKPG